ncbi:50S ribosomal protein L32e [Candidatus Woesearchaeota archaeon]|nr:50S ribosomal protein L32e [Candidatus Woesearchaeota archaeon]
MIENLLKIRNEMKDRKPHFIRQDHQRRKKLGRKLKWRKPKGIHSKIRHQLKGRRKMPSPGHKSPSKVRGLHASGLKITRVHSVNGLGTINKGAEGIVIAKQVGAKKKLDILKKAKELGISVLNLNIDERIRKIEDFINSKKSGKGPKKDDKQKPEAKKEEIRQKEKEQKLTDEEKKEAEKKEKDRLLTKKE